MRDDISFYVTKRVDSLMNPVKMVPTTAEAINIVNERLAQPQISINKYALDDSKYLASAQYQQDYDHLRNKTLRLIVPAIEPPYVNYVNFSIAAPFEVGYNPGVVIEILKDIAQMLNLTYEIIETTNHAWGTMINDTWTGAFGMLAANEVDLIAGAAIVDYDRSSIADLTYPFEFEYTGMLIQSPEIYQDKSFLIVTQPFSLAVWLITASAIIISGIVHVCLTLALQKVYNEPQVHILQSWWIYYSILVQQGLPEQPRSISCRIIVAMWWLASITLMASFTGSLVALFAVDKAAAPFQGIEELVKQVRQGKFVIVMDGNSLMRTEMIARSNLTVYKELWHEISVNQKVVYVDGLAKGVDLVASEPGYVLLGPINTLSYLAYMDCRIETLPDGYLDLGRSQGVFWVLIAGLTLGLLVFLIELIINYLIKELTKRGYHFYCPKFLVVFPAQNNQCSDNGSSSIPSSTTNSLNFDNSLAEFEIHKRKSSHFDNNDVTIARF